LHTDREKKTVVSYCPRLNVSSCARLDAMPGGVVLSTIVILSR